MRTIYVDSEYICHIEPAEDTTAIETDVFDGKCKAYVEGYRYLPEGETWTASDGAAYNGLMVVPAKDFSILEAAQSVYDEIASIYLAMMGVEE